MKLCQAFAKNYGKTRDLSPRELEILEALSKGAKNKELAEMFFISENTVKNHIVNIRKVLGAKNRVEATHWYLTVYKKDKE